MHQRERDGSFALISFADGVKWLSVVKEVKMRNPLASDSLHKEYVGLR